MTETAPINEQVCRECGGTLPIDANYCWLCYRPLTPVRPRPQVAENAGVGQSPFADTPSPDFGFALAMAAVVLVAILLGVSLMAPGVGVLLALIVIPIYLRVCFTASRSPVRVQPMSAGKAVAIAGVTIGMAILIAFVGIAAIIVAVVIAVLSICSGMVPVPGM